MQAPRLIANWLMRPWVKPLLGAVCLLPLAGLVWGIVQNTLGANPQEVLIRATGDWTLRFLCIVLAITPLRQHLNLPALARFRRMLGLFVFGYASLHALAYAGFDMGFEWSSIGSDIIKRSFIWMGLITWLGLWLLALTSFNQAIKWLGAAKWKRLHQLVYVLAATSIVHFWWMRSGKNNTTEVVVYAIILAVLLLSRWRPKT
jgi:sulfoxide reductase heme-binding subunit YedZ